MDTNGRQKGRAVPELDLYVFRDSGEQVRVRKLGPTTLQRINEAVRKECMALPHGHPHRFPEPPTQEVDIGGEKRKVRNDREPDYLRRLQAWQNWAASELNERFLRVCAVHGLEPERDDDDIAEQVEALEAVLKIEGVELQRDERYSRVQQNRILYLMHICFTTQQEMEEFYTFMIQRVVPQPQEVEEATAMFRTAE
jgi:hypothetical protein